MKKLIGLFVFVIAFSVFLLPKTTIAQVVTDKTYAGYSAFFDTAVSQVNNANGINSNDKPKVVSVVTSAKYWYDNTYRNSTATTEGAKLSEALQKAYDSVISDTDSTFYLSLQAGSRTPAESFLSSFGGQLRVYANEAGIVQQLATTNGTTTQAAQSQLNSQTANLAGTQATALNEQPQKCSFGPSFSMSACINDFVTWLIKVTLLNIASVLLWAASSVLNMSMQYGVFQFASWAPASLYPLWQIVRQVMSLCIIFAGLYVGFMYIINQQDIFIKRFIPWLVVFAFFVNFSYPISRALIDISNVTSLNIYSQATGNANLLDKDYNGPKTMGSEIMTKLGLQDLIFTVNNPSNTSLLGNLNSPGIALVAVAYVLYAAYVLFMCALLIMTRTFVLIFTIIGSPILLIDSVIPKLGEYGKKLRSLFFGQLAVSIIFTIMFYFVIKVMEILGTALPAKISNLNGSPTSADIAGMFFGILMMLILLHIMLKVTKSLSGAIGEVVTKYGNAALGATLGLAAGGAGLAGRAVIGRGAAGLAESQWMQKAQGSALGRMAYNATNSVGNSSFDLRNSGIAQRAGGAFASTLGIKDVGLGKGSQTSYNKNLAERTTSFKKKYGEIKDDKARQEYARNVSNSGIFGEGKKITKEVFSKEEEEARRENKGIDALTNKYRNSTGEDRQNLFKNSSSDAKQAMKGTDEAAGRNDESIANLMTEAKEIDKTVKSYNESSSPDKELILNMQEQSVKDMLVGSDKTKAQKVNNYGSVSGNTKQQYFEKQNDDTKEAMLEKDKAEAEKENMERDKQEATKTDKVVNAYNNKSDDTKRKIFDNQKDDIKKILMEQDRSKAEQENKNRGESTPNTQINPVRLAA